jgi:nitroreductase
MELDACISGRRSVRRYEDRPVPKAVVDKLLEAGVSAPSGMNAQPWRFVVVQNREVIGKLSRRTKELLLGMQWPGEMKEAFKSDKDTIFYGAPLLIMMCVPINEEWKTVNLLDCGLATENMFLEAYQEGLGSCFIGFANFLNQDQRFLDEVGIPEDHELVAPLIFGYPSENPAPKRHEVKVLKWIQ